MLTDIHSRLRLLASLSLVPLAGSGCADDAADAADADTSGTSNPTIVTTGDAGDTGNTTTQPGSTGSTTTPIDDTESSTSGSTGPSAICGDGVVEGDEACEGDEVDAECPVFGTVTCTETCTLDTSGCSETVRVCATSGAAIDETTPLETPLEVPVSIADDFFVADVNVEVDVTHPWVEDLFISVVDPAGTVRTLIDSPCEDLENVDAVFDDDGSPPACSNTPPAISGTVAPLETLTPYVGARSMGEWTLEVADLYGSGDDGTLNEWCLELTLSPDDPVTCGDAIVSEGEVCDGASLAGESCESLEGEAFIGGELGCAADCLAYDTSACVLAGCNGGVIDGDEDCDGTDFGGETCTSLLGNFGGPLACNGDCTFDTSGCTAAVCGDDTVEGEEVCESGALDGVCVDLGYASGAPECEDCTTLDVANCVPFAVPYAQDFESVTVPAMPSELVSSGDAAWFTTTDFAQEGLQAAQSGAIDHDESSSITLILSVDAPTTFVFAYRTSTEFDFDFLELTVDGLNEGEWSGQNEWTQEMLELDSGVHTVTWTYSKDGSDSSGADAVWVDMIQANPAS